MFDHIDIKDDPVHFDPVFTEEESKLFKMNPDIMLLHIELDDEIPEEDRTLCGIKYGKTISRDISINISKPGITKGQHWHNSKWEQFIVVHGHGLIEERNINTGEKVSFEVSGDKIEAIYMIPGWTHNSINLSDTEDLVTVMTCNEVFDPKKPDTFFEPV